MNSSNSFTNSKTEFVYLFLCTVHGRHGRFLAGKTPTVAVTSLHAAAAAFYFAKSRQVPGLAGLIPLGGPAKHIL